MDTNVFNQPKESYVPKCHYCGRFIGKNDYFEGETIYGQFSIDSYIFYHKKCKDEKERRTL